MTSQIKPNLSLDDAKRLVQELFEFKVINVQCLTSYTDQNFKIECESMKNFTLKILNSDDSNYENLIKAEHDIFSRLRNKFVVCPLAVFNINNQNYFYIDNDYKLFIPNEQTFHIKKHIVRLLEYIPGKPIGEVKFYNESLLFNVGKFAGSLDLALEGFYDEIYENRDCPWYLDKLKNYTYRLDYVNDLQRKPILKNIIENFYQTVMNDEKLKYLRKGTIHGDFNETNILVDNNEESISGILDFGDVSYSYYVFELAICALYMMLDAVKTEGSCNLNQIEIAAHVIAGYMSIFKLNLYEYNCILMCIKARIAQSLINGSYSIIINPTNAYVTITQNNSWNLLCLLNNTDDDKIYIKWNYILKEQYNISIF